MSYESDMNKAIKAYDEGRPEKGRRAVVLAIVKHPVKFWKNLDDRERDTPLDRVYAAFENESRRP